MLRGLIAVAAAAAVVLALAVGAIARDGGTTTTTTNAVAGAATTAAGPKLAGTVGPGFTVTLERNGKTVKSLRRGTYRLTVTDRSPEHNFALVSGGGTRVVTEVGFTGTKTVTVKLTKGRYAFVCQPHAPAMRGSFTVGAVARTAATTSRATTTTTTTDDKGGHGEAEPGDDKGGHGEAEPGDDHGGDDD